MQKLTDPQWARISAFLKSHPRVYKAESEDTRRFLDAVCWVLRTGAQWRALPADLGNWSSAWDRFSAWCDKGVFAQMLEHFADADADLEWLCFDSTTIRAHMCASGQKSTQPEQALGRSRGGFTTKLHVKVDAHGMPLKLALTAGQRNDKIGWPLLREQRDEGAECALADKGYDSNKIRADLEQIGVDAVIPPTRSRVGKLEYDEHIYAHRHVVECFIGKIKWFRRVFTRFDTRADVYLGFVILASCLVWMR